jgi:predicted transcriptional regulator
MVSRGDRWISIYGAGEAVTLQFENPISLARKYKGAPLAVLWVLYFTHQRVSQSYLESMTGYTDKTISSALRYLKEDGVIDYQPSGWLLCEGLPLQLSSITQDENCRRNSELPNYLSQEVEDINNINNTSTNYLNLTPPVVKNPSIEAIQDVLDAAADLFGRPILGDPRDYADIDRLLSWIAQAYQGSVRQGKLMVKNPAGLIYWAFHQGKGRPVEKKYLDPQNLEKYLTERFMRASGQWEFEDIGDEEITK